MWIVDKAYQIDFNEAPSWATKVAWRREGDEFDSLLHRVWVDNNNTRYQYLRGFGSLKDQGVVFYENFFALDYVNSASIIAHRQGVSDEIPEPASMVCHDKYGDMTDEFRKYSQLDWDAVREEARQITRRAIRDGVNPIAMKELMLAAIDCGVTLGKMEAKVNGE